jgi:probable HAF family extracellular repeat protein
MLILFVIFCLALPAAANVCQEIAVPGSAGTEAFGINTAGQIVGDYSTSAGELRGFLLSNGSYTDIVYPGSTFNVATGINDSGVISGYYADANSHYHGFVYESGTFTQIDYPGATGTQAMSINNTGIVVGSFWDPTGRSHGFRLRNGTRNQQLECSSGLLHRKFRCPDWFRKKGRRRPVAVRF